MLSIRFQFVFTEAVGVFDSIISDSLVVSNNLQEVHLSKAHYFGVDIVIVMDIFIVTVSLSGVYFKKNPVN
jgi:hypothetical protein